MSAVCYLCHNEAGEITSVIRGDSEHMSEPTGSFIKYTGTKEVSTKWYIKDGVAKEKGEQPSKSHTFNVTSESWELDLSDAKSRAWDRIKLSREADECGTFTWSDNTFQCDEHSQRKLMLTMQRALIDSSLSMAWTLANNTVKTFSSADYLNIGTAMSTHINACHEKAKGLRTKINAATTQDELDAITY
tara:strand:+ start:2879 stop:3445 length:567 start_codon:yes stop_codon:yes gene_type:complete